MQSSAVGDGNAPLLPVNGGKFFFLPSLEDVDEEQEKTLQVDNFVLPANSAKVSPSKAFLSPLHRRLTFLGVLFGLLNPWKVCKV